MLRRTLPFMLAGVSIGCGSPHTSSPHSSHLDVHDTQETNDTGDCAMPWYADNDADGYGNPLESIVSCSQPQGYVSDNTDCDDVQGTINPEAEEICKDGLDNNCNGSADACAFSQTYSITYWGESAADVSLYGPSVTLFGYAVAFADSDGDGDDDLFFGAPFASSDGGVYFLPSPVVDASYELLEGAEDDFDAGLAVAGLHDVNNDGYDDVAISAPAAPFGDNDHAGKVYVVPGPLHAEDDAFVLGEKDIQFGGEFADEWAGYSVAGVGDTNNDGVSDILIGAYAEGSGAYKEGAAYLVNGPLEGISTLSTADAKLIGEAQQDVAGFAVGAGGDVNSDGFNDLLVGAYGNDYVGSYTGAAYVLYGPVSGTHNLSTADARLFGEITYGRAGYAVAGDGDVNNDGYDDVFVGAPGDPFIAEDGAAYLLLGPLSGDVYLSSAEATFVGEKKGKAGKVVSIAGDIDNDGLDDLLIGAPFYTNELEGEEYPDAGCVSLFYAPVSGSYTASQANASFSGGGNDLAGYSLASNGDANNDGYADILIGAPDVDKTANTGVELEDASGAAYLFYGNGM